MRTTEEMREYQRKRRELIKRRAKNRAQQQEFKTVGGRFKYSACTKTKQTPRLGVFAEPACGYRRNGVQFYGYTL